MGLLPELKDGPLTADTLAYHRVPLGNDVLRQLGLNDPLPPEYPPEMIWNWRGRAFAVSHERTGLRPLPGFDFT